MRRILAPLALLAAAPILMGQREPILVPEVSQSRVEVRQGFTGADLLLYGAVIDPRGVLSEFGVTVSEDKEVRVWDSTAEMRYLVLPQRPDGTDGWSEERLATLVTRDSMIGTGLPLEPSEVSA